MKCRIIMIFATICLFLMTSLAVTNADWLKGATEDQLKTLAKIMPGLGTVMIEYGQRLTNAYYAAKGGNWELAEYMIKEATEIQEVGETTRPARAEALKTFESEYLVPLNKTVKAKDFNAFKKSFNKVVNGCNDCHSGQGFAYIKYKLPKQPFAPLSTMKP